MERIGERDTFNIQFKTQQCFYAGYFEFQRNRVNHFVYMFNSLLRIFLDKYNLRGFVRPLRLLPVPFPLERFEGLVREVKDWMCHRGNEGRLWS